MRKKLMDAEAELQKSRQQIQDLTTKLHALSINKSHIQSDYSPIDSTAALKGLGPPKQQAPFLRNLSRPENADPEPHFC